MKITSCLFIALILSIGSAEGKGNDKTKPKKSSVASAEKTTHTEWKRSTEGHRPQDLDGDGIITRKEWPGNDVSFRELDRDGDGVLTNKDRGYGAQGGEKRMYERPVNDYRNRKRK